MVNPEETELCMQQTASLVRFVKGRLGRDATHLYGYEAERANVRQLLQRTAETGESNSMLLIGPRGCGKTTLINAVLMDLVENAAVVENTLIVRLDGSLHTSDRLALRSITAQMRLENAADGKVFGSFAENLAFLLQCLKAGGRRAKSVVFILEEFDLFCAHHNQTLLYNLFDVAQSAQAPICVLGVTCRLDVVELLEKRVKSRFSHRQVFLFPPAGRFEEYVAVAEQLLHIPDNEGLLLQADDYHRVHKGPLHPHVQLFDPSVGAEINPFSRMVWNGCTKDILTKADIRSSLQELYDFDVGVGFLKMFLFRLVNQLSGENYTLKSEMFQALVAQYTCDDKVDLLCGLSVLELCLIIAIKHHSEIYDRDPFNFEIIFARLSKFAKSSSSMQNVERSIVLKAFEHLRVAELILPVGGGGGSGKVQKEFEMHKLALTYGQIQLAVQRYQALATEVAQWAKSSLI
ncbi:hypothetical protein KR018_005225 [Drosophila ironensis]|nr:hypothetical protein KR018_005225 [Drosophila ironensis]